MKNKLLLAVVSTSFLSSAVFAGSMEPVEASSGWMGVVTATAGSDFVSPGRSQKLTLLPPFQNYYTKGDASTAVVDVGGFVGIERTLTEKLSLQLGISGYRDSSMIAKGDVWQFALPVFDDLSYTYHIHHARVMAVTKLLSTMAQYPLFHPYVSGEIGAAFNQASEYQETPLEAGVIPISPFSNHSQRSFAWSVGAGIDYNLSQRVRIGVGYQFADLGAVSLGLTTAQTTKQHLSLSHLHANQLRFQVTFLV